VIQAQNLVKSYELGGQVVHALDDVSLHIDSGEMVAIRGASGSGKSTLMNILGCLDRPDSGTYVLAGEDVSQLEEDELAEVRSRRIGFVFQTFNLLPRMSAVENVELPIQYAGGADAYERAVMALEMVGLGNRMHHQPNQMSGGQRQRVAVARALANDPDIILADEPTGNLDSRNGEAVMGLLSELHESGATIVMVTHDDRFARCAERTVHLFDGRVIEEEREENRVALIA
jgi:putative ABC transport system ATP-binding protein